MTDVDKPQENGWHSRNNVIKKFKPEGKLKSGWIHLVIGEDKVDKKRHLRLVRYKNWFKIPSPEYLLYVQELLKKGTQELGWETNGTQNVNISEESMSTNNKESLQEQAIIDVPEDIIDFIRSHPKAAKRLIDLVDLDKLEDDDFKYITEIFQILNDKFLSASKKLKYSFQEFLGKVSKEPYKNIEELSELMNSWSLLQITSLTQIVRKRLNDIDMFEKMIHDEKTYELSSDNSIHRILEKSMWIVDDEYWIAQSNKSLRTFIGDEISGKDAKKRPDFVCVTHGNKLIILEIKRPSLVLGKDELDQAERYLVLIKKRKSKQYSSIKTILVGNEISEEAKDIVDSSRPNIEIMTYQDLLENCRQRYQEYLDIVENQDNLKDGLNE